jgi:hypothetical protein
MIILSATLVNFIKSFLRLTLTGWWVTCYWNLSSLVALRVLQQL